MKAHGWVCRIQANRKTVRQTNKKVCLPFIIKRKIYVTSKLKLKHPYLVKNDGEMTLRNTVALLPAWNESREHS